MRKSNAVLMNLGAFFLLLALFFSNISIASNDYRIILLLALACMVLADL